MHALLLMLALVLTLGSPRPAAADQMFKCDDGTFTNVVERMCTPYEPHGTVLVMPPGATLASVKAMLGEAPPKGRIPAPLSVCQLYQEWVTLNLKTGGGVTFPETEDVPRWLALSRIFTAIVPPPYCP